MVRPSILRFRGGIAKEEIVVLSSALATTSESLAVDRGVRTDAGDRCRRGNRERLSRQVSGLVNSTNHNSCSKKKHRFTRRCVMVVSIDTTMGVIET